ncbi:2-C-methyl-D-erythritol 4-phosphate cytidylyltransferase [Fictibacillus gelatini]|uniref:2-C-methyl-D-erythritol 4-phosphate cytidylyltransferase n=1 Tax=Fictibacillus gelatini TaxID=225985 RepID=UPI00054D1AD7|nr:2-C-methyl-D-erythritol 4-phosphate cytidylyltransferase [Fictibacillus gelatini]
MYSVVIPAAGQGKRMKAGKNKLWIELAGKPILSHTIQVFENDPWCREVILVGNTNELDQLEHLKASYQFCKVTQIVPGGEERQQSVFEGLKRLTGDDSIVLIHDGARPFIGQDSIHQLVQLTEKTGAAVIAVPIKDTVKKVMDHQVVTTIDRSSLWAVQTPQAFRLSIVFDAHKQAAQENYIGTDDASLVERYGQTVSIVEGDYFNIKLTTVEDLVIAKAILSESRGKI